VYWSPSVFLRFGLRSVSSGTGSCTENLCFLLFVQCRCYVSLYVVCLCSSSASSLLSSLCPLGSRRSGPLLLWSSVPELLSVCCVCWLTRSFMVRVHVLRLYVIGPWFWGYSGVLASFSRVSAHQCCADHFCLEPRLSACWCV